MKIHALYWQSFSVTSRQDNNPTIHYILVYAPSTLLFCCFISNGCQLNNSLCTAEQRSTTTVAPLSEVMPMTSRKSLKLPMYTSLPKKATMESDQHQHKFSLLFERGVTTTAIILIIWRMNYSDMWIIIMNIVLNQKLFFDYIAFCEIALMIFGQYNILLFIKLVILVLLSNMRQGGWIKSIMLGIIVM